MLTLALQIQIYIKAERIPANTAIASNGNGPGSKLGSERNRQTDRQTDRQKDCPVLFFPRGLIRSLKGNA